MESLPVELKLRILRELPPRSVARMECVSHAWNALAQDHWEHVDPGLTHRSYAGWRGKRDTLCERQMMEESLRPPTRAKRADDDQGLAKIARSTHALAFHETSLVAWYCAGADEQARGLPLIVESLFGTGQDEAAMSACVKLAKNFPGRLLALPDLVNAPEFRAKMDAVMQAWHPSAQQAIDFGHALAKHKNLPLWQSMMEHAALPAEANAHLFDDATTLGCRSSIERLLPDASARSVVEGIERAYDRDDAELADYLRERVPGGLSQADVRRVLAHCFQEQSIEGVRAMLRLSSPPDSDFVLGCLENSPRLSAPFRAALIPLLESQTWQVNDARAQLCAQRIAFTILQHGFLGDCGQLLKYVLDLSNCPLDGSLDVLVGAALQLDDASMLRRLQQRGVNLATCEVALGDENPYYPPQRVNPVTYATIEGQLEALEFLLSDTGSLPLGVTASTEAIANLVERTVKGKSPPGNIKRIVAALTMHGADLNGRHRHLTHLMRLVQTGGTGPRRLMEALLNNGADVHVTRDAGNTALHFAAEGSESATLLLAHGANPAALNWNWEPASRTSGLTARRLPFRRFRSGYDSD